ncbi:MAG TPA: LLM class F420-dependent oxidoreductase [Aldersonia sp.]
MGYENLGSYGVWRGYKDATPDVAVGIEQLGYGTLWLGGCRRAALDFVDPLLSATTTLTVATGIADIWANPVDEFAASFHRIERRFPGRFLLGIGAGHPEAHQAYTRPYRALVDYLDALDAAGVPRERRALAALGPKVLELSAARTLGAHPYLTPPAHTRFARDVLGPDALLAPEQKVVLETDPARAREIGRPVVDRPYLHLRNYVANLHRLGYTDADIADGGSDALIDDLVAHGDADAIAARLRAHLGAGANHVAIQVLPQDGDPLPALRALADVLQIGCAQPS